MTEAITNPLGTDPDPTEALPPCCVVMFQDNPNGELEFYLQQRPEAFDEKSPAHVMSWFFQNNVQAVIEAAHIEYARHKRLNSDAPEAPVKIVLPANLTGDVA